MIIIKRIIYMVLCLILIGTLAYGFSDTSDTDDERIIKDRIEKMYGVNIVIPENEEYSNYVDCMLILERGIKRFPDNIIKEITDYYLRNDIVTNVIFNKTEIIKDLFSEYTIDESSVNIYIKTLESSLYSESCFAAEEAMIHELGHFISDYMFEVYDFSKIEDKFLKLNTGYEYGSWGEGYCKVFVNKHSASSFEDEIADLIWYAQAHPSVLRNINDGRTAIIHEKLRILGEIFDEVFNSIGKDSRLWLDAIPQKPEAWALEIIQKMKSEGFIPKEFGGLYESYITREEFYKLIINMLYKKFGEENLNNHFNLTEYEEHVALDPINGEVFAVDGMNYTSYYNLLCNNNKILLLSYQMGIISQDSYNDPTGYMTRLEIAKILVYIGNELGMDISNYNIIDYNDIQEVEDSEKPYIYIVSDKGFLKGTGENFKPFNYCTYQEAYIILMRFYNAIN